MERIELTRIHSGEDDSLYLGSDSHTYLVRTLDTISAVQSGTAEYVLSRQLPDGRRWVISGLFATEIPGVFSGDALEEIGGTRRTFTFCLYAEGSFAEIIPDGADDEGGCNRYTNFRDRLNSSTQHSPLSIPPWNTHSNGSSNTSTATQTVYASDTDTPNQPNTPLRSSGTKGESETETLNPLTHNNPADNTAANTQTIVGDNSHQRVNPPLLE